jgi:hypothetical protein
VPYNKLFQRPAVASLHGVLYTKKRSALKPVFLWACPLPEPMAMQSIDLRKSAHSVEGHHSLNKKSYFSRINRGSPRPVPSKLPRNQGVVPHTAFPRPNSHVEQKEGEEKQGINKLDRADPLPRTSGILWSAASLVRCHWP